MERSRTRAGIQVQHPSGAPGALARSSGPSEQCAPLPWARLLALTTFVLAPFVLILDRQQLISRQSAVSSTAPAASMSPAEHVCAPLETGPHVTPRRVLFLTLEYKAGTFSGNGIYSQSMVRSLSALGHSVFVVSAGPKPGDSVSRKTIEFELLEIPVEVWGRLDWNCGWQEFAAGVGSEAAAAVAAFKPEWALVVDWSAVGAYQALAAQTGAWEQAGASLPTMTYLNYRVYTVSEYKGDKAAEEKLFYKEREGAAVAMAGAVAALSTRDAKYLQHNMGVRRPSGAPEARALLPPLREDIRQRALQKAGPAATNGGGATAVAERGNEGADVPLSEWRKGRKFLSCCVRLSPEKNADLFASLVEHLAPFLSSHGIVPLLCAGANSGDPYAQAIKKRISEAAPSALIIEGFMGPDKMGELYAQTLMNIHPCLYDAYGMTMVEAAAFGAPSVVNVGPGGAVGATELLVPEQGFSIALDLSQEPAEIAKGLNELLGDVEMLGRVGSAAQKKSLSWSEEANARELTCIADAS